MEGDFVAHASFSFGKKGYHLTYTKPERELAFCAHIPALKAVKYRLCSAAQLMQDSPDVTPMARVYLCLDMVGIDAEYNPDHKTKNRTCYR